MNQRNGIGLTVAAKTSDQGGQPSDTCRTAHKINGKPGDDALRDPAAVDLNLIIMHPG